MSHHSVQFTRFDTTRTPAPESFDLWREVLRGSYDLTAANQDRPSLRISTGLWEAERLVLGYCKCEAGRVDRRGALVGRSGRFLKLRWFSRGEVRLVHGADTTVIRPGATHLIDQSREIIEISTEHEQRTVFVPHVLVGYEPARHPVWASFPLDEPIGRVLADAANSFYREMPQAADCETSALEAAFIGMLRGLLSGALDSTAEKTVAKSRANAMQSHLDRHLREPGLGVTTLLNAFGAARSTIYRDFEAVGGVNRYILDRRLERAFAELANHPGRRGIVRRISEGWCFESSSHFTRLFRDRYGMSPSEAVGLNARSHDDDMAVDTASQAEVERSDSDPEALSRVYRRIARVFG